MKINCSVCKKELYRKKSAIKKAKHSYCSIQCKSIVQKGIHFSPKTEFKKGFIPWDKGLHTKSNGILEKYIKKYGPWNKGKKGLQNWMNLSGLEKGRGWSKGKTKETDPIVKRISEARKGKKRPEISGENAYQWKGDKVGYGALHDWVRKLKGKPTICTHCAKESSKLEWANKSQEYKRDLDDWIRLCKSCHRKYDWEFSYAGR